ncbi:hypothetical protein DFA_06960 [Cavenderia fasciculata]|uniref:HAT C-terminal dimerisation domain-containing protein n=1 Tax=Cavenderia fasciculata TaxID=261658 RepID=F4PX54_CACFS|nr:uncharacterized protein DFA_06960 [Cavenderia fasciculata]EGG19857.1 hypothetical protein DFA_06960 [Cavenderia fasciculata]|eukprot:XP_004358203.1 hypothetical protein DFA_06960 [Cavenderia fasciculata]
MTSRHQSCFIIKQFSRHQKLVNDKPKLINMDILSWWHSQKESMPVLYDLVQKYMCIPSSSAPCERIFSKAGTMCTSLRNRMSRYCSRRCHKKNQQKRSDNN